MDDVLSEGRVRMAVLLLKAYCSTYMEVTQHHNVLLLPPETASRAPGHDGNIIMSFFKIGKLPGIRLLINIVLIQPKRRQVQQIPECLPRTPGLLDFQSDIERQITPNVTAIDKVHILTPAHTLLR